MKEIITIFVGEAGLKVGKEYWRLLANEHGVDFVTGKCNKQIEGSNYIYKVFEEDRQREVFTPRSIFMDSNEISYENVFEEHSIATNWTKVLGSYESSVNFAEGKYNVFSKMKNNIETSITKELEKWDSLDTVLIFGSTCGGTSSAFISKFAATFKDSINFIQVPNYSKMNNPIEIYNSELWLSQLYLNEGFSVITDNNSVYNLYKQKKKYFDKSTSINENCFDKINKVLAHVYSNITAPSRFGNSYSLK